MQQPSNIPDAVLKQLDDVAERVARDLSKALNREIRPDAEGVAELDNWILDVRERWDKPQIATMATAFGAFFGTAIINEVGGTWVQGDGEPMIHTACEVPYTAAPFSKVVKQFANGSKDSIMQMLDLLLGSR